MVSRDTKLQIGVVSAVVLVWALLFRAVPLGPVASVVLVAATYFAVLAGTHLYLALAGDSETLPVAARWRYIGLAAVVAVVELLQGTVGSTSLGSGTVAHLLGGVFAVTVVSYLVYEARAGYLASRQ
ncbi:hypothetical protein BDK61_1428 [Haloarcula quadrata]|uniref:Uncharacterized protein n=1 Tax=Haloarcula quadrata TaxID=182779 RepID=A0A495R480_9EURY|nr:hypothetical protein [Haloarcula quadrata]RKS82131.1 hypothetical protein BDK61_1428 [Haloarcula quadrata]